MQVLFESRDPQAAPMRDWAERRVRFVMRRLSGGLLRARVQLSDDNGPRGGVDKCCHLALAARDGRVVAVSTRAAHWRAAVDLALARAARSLLRHWQRQHSVQQRPAGAQRRQPLEVPS